MRLLRNILLFTIIAAPAFALTVDKPLPDPAQEARAKALFHDIRCVVCQSEAIADSPAEVARDMRREIREAIATGNSDQEIIANLTARYGDGILMNPKLTTKTALLWFGPWVLLIIATIFLHCHSRLRGNDKKKI